MTAGLIIIPNYMPAFDRNGFPLSGAKLYSYINNTTTPVTVYADASLTTPLPNPVEADSSGVFPAIYGDNATAYTIAIATRADVPTASYTDVTVSGKNKGDKGDPGGSAFYPGSRVAMTAIAIPAGSNRLITTGSTTDGDGGHAGYKRVATEPLTVGTPHPAKFRTTDRFLPNGTVSSSNGGWWQIDERPVSARHMGAAGTFDDASAAVVYLRDYMDAMSQDLSGLPDPKSLIKGHIPAGSYQITTSEALMNGSFLTKRLGYTIEGDGSGYTEIFFNPTDGGSLIAAYNRARQTVRIAGVTWLSDNAANGFWSSLAENGSGRTPQDYTFEDLNFGGAWGNIFQATGDGNNSEWVFRRCRVGGPGSTYNGFAMAAFLYLPSSGSDQQVNILFDTCYPWPGSTDVNTRFLKLQKGGSVHVRNCDFSNWQAGTIFELTTASSQFNMEIVGSRVEAKTALVKIVDCSVTGGVFTARDCNFAVNAPAVTDLTQVCHQFVTGPGPNILYSNCDMQGAVKFIRASSESRRYSQAIKFDNCRWLQYNDIFDATTPAFIFDSVSGQLGGNPAVVVENCTGNQNAINSGAWVVSTAYSLNTKVRNGLSEYICITAGTSTGSGPGPLTKAADITDGTAHWKWVRNEPRCYVNDTVLNWHRTIDAKGVRRRQVQLVDIDGNLPTGSGYCEVILPPNVYVVSAGLEIPAYSAGNNLGINSASAPTLLLQTDDASQTFIDNTASVTAASAGVSLAWTGRFFTGVDPRRRAIKLTPSGASPAAAGTRGALAYIEYIG